MRKTLIQFTNRRLLDIWVEPCHPIHDRFMVVCAFALYPLTLFIAWLCLPEAQIEASNDAARKKDL